MNLNVEPLPFRKRRSRGFPHILRPFRALIEGSTQQRRAVISLFKMVNNLTVEPVVNLDTVTRPFTGHVSESLSAYAENFTGLREYNQLAPKSIRLSTKAGPNGPATATCLADLTALKGSPSLLGAVSQLCQRQGLAQTMTMDYRACKEPKYRDNPVHRRLIAIQDKAGKSRVIAIGDYWSQTGLKPIHD